MGGQQCTIRSMQCERATQPRTRLAHASLQLHSMHHCRTMELTKKRGPTKATTSSIFSFLTPMSTLHWSCFFFDAPDPIVPRAGCAGAEWGGVVKSSKTVSTLGFKPGSFSVATRFMKNVRQPQKIDISLSEIWRAKHSRRQTPSSSMRTTTVQSRYGCRSLCIPPASKAIVGICPCFPLLLFM